MLIKLYEKLCKSVGAYDSLDAAMKLARKQGVKSSQHQGPSDVITRNEECILWEKEVLGSNNPQQMIRTLVYLSGINFGLRGGQELRDLEIDQNIFVYDDHIIYEENYSKQNNGGLRSCNIKQKKRKITETENEHDYVSFVKEYMKRR